MFAKMRYLSIFIYCAYFAFVLVLADRDDVVFRDNYGSRNKNQWQQTGFQNAKEPSQTFRVAKSIPLDFIQKLNSITNEEEFIQFVEIDPLHSVAPSTSRVSHTDPERSRSIKRLSRLTDVRHLARDTEIEPPQIALAYASLGSSRLGDGVVSTRIGGDDSQNDKKNTAPTPKPANCQPELRTVNLRDTEDPTLYYYPSCTRVDRCGGCCSHELLSCQPVTMEYKNFSVAVAQYNGGHKLELKGRKIVTVETHTKCKCDCKVKPKDCTSLQEYKKSECRCVCTNKDDEAKCTKDKNRLWNPSTCSCQCREVQDCSTGLSFDETSCSCQPYSKPYSPDYSLDRTRYNIGYPGQ